MLLNRVNTVSLAYSRLLLHLPQLGVALCTDDGIQQGPDFQSNGTLEDATMASLSTHVSL